METLGVVDNIFNNIPGTPFPFQLALLTPEA